ncbi:thiol-disulfide isomerase/thioredoxin [Mumia flava]|uniref:Thiol-disulfide isomerase/thioredoxin n=1 Tax=Mumia flava TaxID=1348852 RepID=A0A0B2BJ74_9ACTN|nr:TlpA disulfide reductase family protein [Mumia flava]PJJ57393.1 thiol-disulfide isomerase/thioredoxin [Mumia flava]
MSRSTLVAVLLGAVVVLAACGGEDLSPADAPEASGSAASVDADAAELAAAKADAGIEPCPRTSKRGAVPDGLPAVVLECLGGGAPVNLAGLPGTPTVINLWASWCGPCRDELPELARLHTEAGGQVAVLGVDYRDPDPLGAIALAADSGVTYPLVSDPDEAVRDALGVIGLPQTVFVDASGTIVATERRPVTDYDDLVGLVDEHLGVDLR